MKPRRRMHRLAAALLLLPIAAHALTMRLDGDKLWLEAQDTPLADILTEFARLGVQIQADALPEGRISSTIRGRKLTEALPAIFANNDYILTWRRLRTPLGRILQLESITLPSEGARPTLRREPYRFPVTRGVTGQGPEFVRDELLLGVRPGTTLEQFQRLLAEIGGTIVGVDLQTGAYLIRLPSGTNVEELLTRLQQNPILSLAELNYVLRSTAPGERLNLTDSASSLAALLANANPEGQSLIAVLDSGFDPASPLARIIQNALDATAPGQDITDPDGHGTLMALIAAGLYQGADPAAAQTITPIKTYDADGATSIFTLLLALAYATESGARIVNMSWGSDVPSTALSTALYTAAQNGLILIASAGNEGAAAAKYPAAYPAVLSIAGTQDGQLWSGSNHGPTVDLSAPATAILPGTTAGTLAQSTGTSVSGALVSHALGQYFNRHPAATTEQAITALFDSLSPPVAPGYGKGTLDAPALQRFLSN